jgi:hypothetical protein
LASIRNKEFAMPFYVHHDVAGNIWSVVSADAPDGGTVMLVPKPGHLVAEVDGFEFEADVDAVRRVAETHRVATPRRATLEKKD